MNNLKKLRLLLDKTQIEIAKETGIPQTTYSYYEQGKTTPDAETLIKLADYFHTTIDYLLGHQVPYLLDKSTLTPKQRKLVEHVCKLDDNTCEMAEAYINGRIESQNR